MTNTPVTAVERRDPEVWETHDTVLDKMLSAAHPATVFGPPMNYGDHTVVTVSEVRGGGGYGFGQRFGRRKPPEQDAQDEGSGGGGGGGAVGRAVAIVVIGPEGVTVKPIIDVTTITRTGIITLGVVLAILLRRRA